MNHRPSPFDRPTCPRWARHLLTLALITVPLTAQQRELQPPDPLDDPMLCCQGFRAGGGDVFEFVATQARAVTVVK